MATAKAKATVTPEEAAGAAEGWRPEPGDTLTGEVVQIEKIDSEWGPYPMITLSTPDGFVNLHAFHQVLLKDLTKLKPRPGDSIAVTYHGKRQAKKDGRDFHHYTVRDPAKPVEAFTWDTADESDDADF